MYSPGTNEQVIDCQQVLAVVGPGFRQGNALDIQRTGNVACNQKASTVFIDSETAEWGGRKTYLAASI